MQTKDLFLTGSLAAGHLQEEPTTALWPFLLGRCLYFLCFKGTHMKAQISQNIVGFIV